MGWFVVLVAFIIVETLFHGLVTIYDSTDDLGYYGLFHGRIRLMLKGLCVCFQGIPLMIEGMLEGLLVCCTPCPLVSASVGEVEVGQVGGVAQLREVAADVEASPPAYFVSDIPFIFSLLIKKTIQNITNIDKIPLKDVGHIV